MKICSKCKESRDLSEFGNNKSKKDGKQTCCKGCVKQINQDYYSRTPEKNEARMAYNKRARDTARQFVWDYLRTHPCIDCPEADPIVLQFDHVRGVKLFNISDAVRSCYNVEKILEEIKKCEVRCANCHIRVTASRGGWYQNIDLDKPL